MKFSSGEYYAVRERPMLQCDCFEENAVESFDPGPREHISKDSEKLLLVRENKTTSAIHFRYKPSNSEEHSLLGIYSNRNNSKHLPQQ